MLTPAQCRQKCPIIEIDDVLGGMWIPKDGVAHPQLICETLMDEAAKMGVTIVESCPVTEVIHSKDSSVSAVNTGRGRVDCDFFVNCAGFWARQIGQMSEPCVKIPLHAAEHYFLHTKPIRNLDPTMPVIRDLDGQIYIREIDGRILGGGFDIQAKPAFQDGTIPRKCFTPVLSVFTMSYIVLLFHSKSLLNCSFLKFAGV